MPRFLLAVLLLLTAAMLQAQVAVTPYGYATQPGALVPAAVPSPPLMFTPSVHLGEAPTTAYYANGLQATLPGVAFAQAEAEAPPPPPTVVVVAPPAAPQTVAEEQPFNFGVAQFSTPTNMNASRSDVAEVARKMKEEKSSISAKTFTNNDIQRLQQQWQTAPAPNTTAPNGAILNNPPK
jgi:hypothetical protein